MLTHIALQALLDTLHVEVMMRQQLGACLCSGIVSDSAYRSGTASTFPSQHQPEQQQQQQQQQSAWEEERQEEGRPAWPPRPRLGSGDVLVLMCCFSSGSSCQQAALGALVQCSLRSG
jgi:hypothetical protein